MLTGTVRALTRSDRAREPRSLAIIAYFDGYARGSNPRASRAVYPRPLDPREARAWREGFTEGRTEAVCHTWHGFATCTHDHPTTPKDPTP